MSLATADDAGPAVVGRLTPEPLLISTITTVRDGADFVGEAVASLLAQTELHFEVVVVDDGSAYATAERLRSFRDPRVRIATLPPSGRVPAVLEAVQIPRGGLLAILDADDLAMPERHARQRAFLDAHPEVGLVGARAFESGDDGGPGREIPAPWGPRRVRRALGMYNPLCFSSVIVRREVYLATSGFRPEDGLAYHKAFLLRVAIAFNVDIIAEPLVCYRRHARQMSASSE